MRDEHREVERQRLWWLKKDWLRSAWETRSGIEETVTDYRSWVFSYKEISWNTFFRGQPKEFRCSHTGILKQLNFTRSFPNLWLIQLCWRKRLLSSRNTELSLHWIYWGHHIYQNSRPGPPSILGSCFSIVWAKTTESPSLWEKELCRSLEPRGPPCIPHLSQEEPDPLCQRWSLHCSRGQGSSFNRGHREQNIVSVGNLGYKLRGY